jgi:hypothetical protein
VVVVFAILKKLFEASLTIAINTHIT